MEEDFNSIRTIALLRSFAIFKIKRTIHIVVIAIFLSITACYVILPADEIEKERLLTFPQFNFAFKKPAGWKITKTSSDECVLQPTIRPNDKSFPVVVVIKASASPTNNLDEYASRLIPENKKAFYENLVQVNDVKESLGLLGSYPAKEILYIGEGATDAKTESITTKEAVRLDISTVNTPVFYKNIFTIKNGTIYILTYGGQEAVFKDFEKDFMTIVNSFVINVNLKKRAEAQYGEVQNRMKKYLAPPVSK